MARRRYQSKLTDGLRANNLRLTRHYCWLLLLLCLLGTLLPSVDAAVACDNDQVCAETLGQGSICNDAGFCTNPLYDGGCLAQMLPNWTKKRICGSEDPPEALALGYCRASPFDYPEIRLSGAVGWETAFMGAWIVQILLSEILEIPTSVEMGMPGIAANLYDSESRMDYGVATDWSAMATSHELFQSEGQTCQSLLAYNSNLDEEDYRSCGHFQPGKFFLAFESDT